MSSDRQLFAQGKMLEDRGELSSAEQAYLALIGQQGGDAELYFRLGVVTLKQRNYAAASEFMTHAIELNPELAEAWSNKGVALAALGKYSDAEKALRRAVQLCPERQDINRNLARVLDEQGKLDSNPAASTNRETARIHPVSGEVRARAAQSSGSAMNLMAAGKYQEAVEEFNVAIGLCPDEGFFHCNLGVAYSRQAKLDKAIESFHRAVQLDPTNAEFQYNLAGANFRRGDLAAAENGYRQALKTRPLYAEALYNLGIVLERQWKIDSAIECYRGAAQLRPDDAEAHNNLGIVLAFKLEQEEAVACFRRAIACKPEYADAYCNLARVLVGQKQLPQAIECYRKALQFKPNCQNALGGLLRQMLQTCMWDDVLELSRRAIDIVENAQPDDTSESFAPLDFLGLPVQTTPLQQRLCAANWAQKRLKSVAASIREPTGYRQRRHDKRRLTIGYLSADFRAQVIAFLVAGLFEQHNKQRIELIGYSYGQNDGSPIRQRIASAVEKFVDLSAASFAESAQKIATDEVDILVDLTGYTSHARTEILVSRPAPIQVNFLGYAGSMAAPFIDYIVVDEFVVPDEQQPFFDERLVHLPGCYFVNDAQRDVAVPGPSRQDCDLPQHTFVFCCFNYNYKITPQVFAVWMDILKQVPASVLWLLEGNAFAPDNLRREARQHGISADRMVFAKRLPMSEHLARYRHADLFLDTVPVNAHTTASDALWVGCPILTLCGETFTARVASSQLNALGLPELITYSFDEYRQLAVRLAREPEMLAALRAKLEANRERSQLFNPAAFARHLEQAFDIMWKLHCSGEKPRAIKVAAG